MRDGEIVGEKTIVANGMECLEIWIGLRAGEVSVFKMRVLHCWKLLPMTVLSDKGTAAAAESRVESVRSFMMNIGTQVFFMTTG